MIKVTVALNPDGGSKVLGFADISLSCILADDLGGGASEVGIKGFRIIEGKTIDDVKKSDWVSMPSRKYTAKGEVHYDDIVTFEKGGKAILSAAILKAYNALKATATAAEGK